MEKITLRGVIKNGQLMVYGQNDLQKFYKLHTLQNKSKPVLMTVEVQPEGKRDRILSYIRAKLIPEIKVALNDKGYRLTHDQVETFILKVTSFADMAQIKELNKPQLMTFIDEVKEYASIELGYYIDDSTVI